MAIADIEALLAMEPAELAPHIVLAAQRCLRQAGNNGMIILSTHIREITPWVAGVETRAALPPGQIETVEAAVIEAWAWLEGQGLIVPMPGMNGQHGWRRLSRKAMAITSPKDFVSEAIARRLDKRLLNPKIRERAWACFIRADFENAAFTALKAVEIAVRDAAGYGNDTYGRSLMSKAFHTQTGPLTNYELEPGEREGMRDLFTGVTSLLKNPLSHRNGGPESASEAVEVIMMANHLLRIVEQREAAKPPPA